MRTYWILYEEKNEENGINLKFMHTRVFQKIHGKLEIEGNFTLGKKHFGILAYLFCMRSPKL